MTTDINLERYFRVAMRWFWLILLSTALAAGVSYRATKLMPRIYRTQTTLLVGGDVTNPNLSDQDIQLAQRLSNGYAAMADEQTVLDGTVKALHLPMDWGTLSTRVLVAHADQTQYITIFATDTDPVRAKAIADEVAHQLILQSPTEENIKQAQQRQQFAQQQLDVLQQEITQGQQDLTAKQAQLAKATTARDVLDAQDQITALQDKITAWRTTYASLLAPSQGLPPNTLRVVETAPVPTSPISPNTRSNVMFAGAAGFVLALVAVLVIEYFNDTVGSPEDLGRAIKLPILGSVGDLGRIEKPADALIAVRDPQSPAAEAYRFLRTSLQFANPDAAASPLVITSPAPGEGKSVTSANLAASYAQAGKRVVLIDADLRHPAQHRYFDVPNESGLSSLVQETNGAFMPPRGPHQLRAGDDDRLRQRVEDALRETDLPGLSLLPAGPVPATANPAELLGSAEMKRVLAVLRGMADVIILDTPPVLPVADSVVLTGEGAAMAVILVVEVGKTRYEGVRLALDSLQAAGAPVLGTMVNKAPNTALVRYRTGYPDYERPARRVLGIFG